MRGNFRNKSVSQHQFAMIPDADIPRSSFNRGMTHKTAFDAGYLVPVYVDEVLPGDTINLRMTAFGRLATPIFPVVDNLHIDSFFFFIPNRLVWANWKKFMGEQVNPADSIGYVVPTVTSPVGGYAVGSLQDYMGLPTVGQVGAGNTVSHSTLFLRAYNLVFNEWFRDENLQNSVVVDLDDGPDDPADYVLLRRGKRKDYFTSALPWPQKGTGVSFALASTAPIKSDAVAAEVRFGTQAMTTLQTDNADTMVKSTAVPVGTTALNFGAAGTTVKGLYTDLSLASAITVNQLRQSFQIQKLMERDARGGTRYTEIVRAHFGVVSPDQRLQRPEYLGGGSTPIVVSPVAQTSASGLSGGSSPLGNLSGVGSFVSQNNGFTFSATEHGIVLGLVSVRADLSYQQGLHRMWSRSTRYDFYFPAFANLGEQAILNKEIYCNGSGDDGGVFGYQERWGEYRYGQNKITGLFRSTAAGTIDAWHLAQKFTSLPTLNESFIREVPPVSRVLAVGTGANGQQILFDSVFDVRMARPMPMYSVPGLIDHF